MNKIKAININRHHRLLTVFISAFVISCCFSVASDAEFKLGMTGAVKAKVKELDDKIMGKANSIEDTLTFTKFTNQPVDFDVLFDTVTGGLNIAPISPYYEYMTAGHPEGPKKWYIHHTTWTVARVYTVAKAVVHKSDLSPISSGGQTSAEIVTYNGEQCVHNYAIAIHPGAGIRIDYEHIMLRKAIADMVNSSKYGYVILESGTHIGYNHNDVGKPVTNLDFRVVDYNRYPGTYGSYFGRWIYASNPLDYFDSSARASILARYQPFYEGMRTSGDIMFSSLATSTDTINITGTLWGVWYKDDLSDNLEPYWAVINLVRKDQFNSETFWQVLTATPVISGMFNECVGNNGAAQGATLYDGAPLGKSLFYILSGNGQSGVAKIVYYDNTPTGDTSRAKYLKYEFRENNASTYFDDKLLMEAFAAQNDAANAVDFSSNAVTFRRTIYR